MGSVIRIAENYGSEAGSGGTVTWHSGSIPLTASQQEYDLQSAFSASVAGSSTATKRIEVQRVFNYGPDAITRFYDPYLGSSDERVMLDNFGFGQMSPASTFVLAPIYYESRRSLLCKAENC